MTTKIFSYGGGVQSTAALVLAAQGQIDYHTFVFCDVGADSENPATINYLHTYAVPFATQHGLNLHIIKRIASRGPLKGQQMTLYQTIMREDSRSIGIPVRMANGAPGRRSCTADFKVRRADRWLKQEGGIARILEQEQHYRRMNQAVITYLRSLNTTPAPEIDALAASLEAHILHPRPLATVALGISTDEWHRASNKSDYEWKQLTYPLLDMHLSRDDCKRIITQAGLPVPPPSSCWFCPMHTAQRWQEISQQTPHLFEQAARMEETINARRETLGRDHVFLHRNLIPLRQVLHTPSTPSTTEIEEQDLCSGGCML